MEDGKRLRPSAPRRLSDAVTEVAGRDGYARLTVDRLLATGGVSRATFYQYFSNVDDCFLSTYRQHAERLLSDVDAAVRGRDRRPFAVLDTLVGTAISRPQAMRLLMHEGLAAGPAGLVERDRLISRIAHTIEGSEPSRSMLDLPLTLLVGGVFRFLSMRVADGGNRDALRDDVREFVEAFARRPSERSWSARFAPALPGHASRSPERLLPTRPGSPPRERILYATAATVREKGYRATTVADIVAAAGVSRRLFYNEFSSRSAAFMAAYEHMFQQLLAVCTPAFFGSRAWPERVWQSALAFTGFFAREPALAYLGFVECYAVGSGFVPRVHDTQLAFTLFLEEGYRQRPEAASLSRSCASFTAAAIFETAFQGCRRNVSLYARRLQPLAVYIALAPFIGSDAAGEFVLGKLSAQDVPVLAMA